MHANGQRGEVIGQIREKEENSVHTVTMTVALSIGRSGEEETDEAWIAKNMHWHEAKLHLKPEKKLLNEIATETETYNNKTKQNEIVVKQADD